MHAHARLRRIALFSQSVKLCQIAPFLVIIQMMTMTTMMAAESVDNDEKCRMCGKPVESGCLHCPWEMCVDDDSLEMVVVFFCGNCVMPNLSDCPSPVRLCVKGTFVDLTEPKRRHSWI